MGVLLHCWLDDREGIRPVKKWVLVCWWWWLDQRFSHHIAAVVIITSIIISSNNTWSGDIRVPANSGLPGRNGCYNGQRERERERERERIRMLFTDYRWSRARHGFRKVLDTLCWKISFNIRLTITTFDPACISTVISHWLWFKNQQDNYLQQHQQKQENKHTNKLI